MSYRIWEIQYAGSPKVLWSGVKPTPEQLATADQLGIQVSPDDTFAAVASAILERVGNAVGCPPRVVSDHQRELADELEIDVTDCASFWSAFVRIQEAIQLSNLDAVRRMGLKPGDIVERSQETEFEFKINGVRKPRRGEEAVVIAPGRIERQSG